MDDGPMVDGNAVAGLLRTVFGAEMTACPAQCANCGAVSEMGALLAFLHGPDVTLRCPDCEEVVVRIAVTPKGTFVDSRGATYIRLEPQTAIGALASAAPPETPPAARSSS